MNNPRNIRIEVTSKAGSNYLDFYQNNGWMYDINLEDFKDSKSTLLWIRQLSEKSWMTTDLMEIVCSHAIGFLNGK